VHYTSTYHSYQIASGILENRNPALSLEPGILLLQLVTDVDEYASAFQSEKNKKIKEK